MVGGNLPPNHAIAVINLLSAPLSPVPRSNLLPERQRARLEKKKKKKKVKKKKYIKREESRPRLVKVCLMDQETTSFY